MRHPIRVLIVEDSASAARAIAAALKDFEVLGIARTGPDALEMARRLEPDVITMDLQMPGGDGLELTRAIRAERPVPIIIVSATIAPGDQHRIFEALAAGAYDVVPKESFFGRDGQGGSAERLLKLVRVAGTRARGVGEAPMRQPRPAAAVEVVGSSPGVVVIGASTGGTAAIRDILADLPADFPVPILAAQHMSFGFMDGFASWLSTQSRLQVRIAVESEELCPGKAYLAPSGTDMMVLSDGRLHLRANRGEHSACPHVDTLFETVARVYGRRAIAMLLTGMGSDGALGLRLLSEGGAVTAVQDEASSVVFGMPREALKICSAHAVLPLARISEWLKECVSKACRPPTTL